MKTAYFAAVIILLCLSNSIAFAQPVHQREISFSAINGSYVQLYDGIERIRAFTQTANNGVKKDYEESLRASASGREIKLPKDFSLKDFSGAPENANDIWYSYSLYDAPIESIEIRLGDYSRSAKIKGTSREQVDAAIGLVKQEFGRLEGHFGGQRIRLNGGLSLSLVGMILLSLCGPLVAIMKVRPVVIIPLAIAGIAFVVSPIALPWASWLPGTMILIGEPSFLTRNSPLITFIGTAGTVVTFIASIAFSAWLARPKTLTASVTPQPPPPPTPPADYLPSQTTP